MRGRARAAGRAGAGGAVLLLDLDGTLVDPAPGILGSLRAALGAVGCAAPPDAELGWVIGPPLRESLGRLLGGPGRVEEALTLYRAAYADGGLYRAAPYPGIDAALDALRADGHRLILCTAKPAPFARRVVDHFGLAARLDGLYGAGLDGRHEDKGDLIAHLLRREGLGAARCCMIGDRAQDTRAAARNGLPSIGVSWGYGGPAELEAGGATALCARPGDLPGCVRRVLSA